MSVLFHSLGVHSILEEESGGFVPDHGFYDSLEVLLRKVGAKGVHAQLHKRAGRFAVRRGEEERSGYKRSGYKRRKDRVRK